jgi:hypothetical protein
VSMFLQPLCVRCETVVKGQTHARCHVKLLLNVVKVDYELTGVSQFKSLRSACFIYTSFRSQGNLTF